MTSWKPAEPDLATVVRAHPRPLDALARGDVPAIILRRAYPEEQCREVVQRLLERDLLYDPARPVARKFIDAAIPEGFYRAGSEGAAESAGDATGESDRRRIDVGTSLGYRGSDPEAFFAHAAATNRLFEELFAGLESPVRVLYDRLADLAAGRRVLTAREPDGRLYGQAIIRAHYGSYTYKPHFDSVRLREKREGYAVYRFPHQFAGVLLLQNTERDGETAQCVIHRTFWRSEIQPHLDADTFHDFAAAEGIESCRVVLEPGDLYFFNTGAIHEVPGLAGAAPRIVLATFIGYGPEEDEIFVWS